MNSSTAHINPSSRLRGRSAARVGSPLKNFFRRDFFIDVSRDEPYVVQSGSGREFPLEILTRDELIKLQDHAVRQVRKSFYNETDNAEELRATLYYLNSWLERHDVEGRLGQDRSAQPLRRLSRPRPKSKGAARR